jgi:hypothetical protein
MAVYTIIRIYEIPANSRYEATDRLMEALELHTEKPTTSKTLSGLPMKNGAKSLPRNQPLNGARFSSGNSPANGEWVPLSPRRPWGERQPLTQRR